MDELAVNQNIWWIILGLTLIFTVSSLIFYYRLDKYDPEPLSYIMVAFIYGLFTPLFTLPIYYWFVELLSLLYNQEVITYISIVIFAPVVEEIAKGFLLIKIIHKYGIDGPMDGLIYGIALGAGFSTIENLIYGVSAYLEGGFLQSVRTLLLRGGFAFIGHPIYSGIFGWGVGAFQVGLTHQEYSEIKLSILLHMIWNAMFSIYYFIPRYPLIDVIVILSVVLFTINQFYRRIIIARNIERKLDEEEYYQNKYKLGYRVRRG